MKASVSILAALALALALVAPVLAQGEDTTVRVTFRLVVYGEPPDAQDKLGAGFTEGDERSSDYFCGLDHGDRSNNNPCEGDGRVYRFRFNYVKNTTLVFDYFRTNGDHERFAEGVREIGTEDATITAYYDYNTGQGGLGEGPGVPEVPDTGAGGMGGSSLPLGNAVAALALLAAGGYATRRRQ